MVEIDSSLPYNGLDEKTEDFRAPSTYNLMFRDLLSFIYSFKGKPLKEQMKTKNFYAVILFLLAMGTTLWILIDPSPSLHTIVSETHRQISNIKNIPSNIRQTKKTLLDVDSKYLDILGFPVSTLQPAGEKPKAAGLQADPVIVVPVFSAAFEQTKTFLASVNKFLPEKFIVFIDLGLGGKENLLLRKTCNSTRPQCEVKLFNYNKYPSHVHSQALGSYVPICIQESLREYGAVIWSDPQEYFLTKEIAALITKARDIGIIAWTIEDTTSSITYPKMFTFFEEKPDNFYFHRAIKTTHLILYNTEFVQTNIMLPWIKCALVEECISPTGSQNSGYCSERRPRYLYSGCHHYEQSALNVILGKVFSYDETKYSTSDKVFGVELMNKTVTSAALASSNN